MFNLTTWLAMSGAIVAHTLAAICFKTAAQQDVRKRILAFFILGNAVGFFNPFCVTIAMSGNNPNLVVAMMGVLGGIFFHGVLNWVFKAGLTRRQWAAILIMIAGGVLLKISSAGQDHAPESPSQQSMIIQETTSASEVSFEVGSISVSTVFATTSARLRGDMFGTRDQGYRVRRPPLGLVPVEPCLVVQGTLAPPGTSPSGGQMKITPETGCHQTCFHAGKLTWRLRATDSFCIFWHTS